ncbi:MAG: ABC transporter ATP-binding protein [Planctomycetaceae bacterium]
MSLLFGVLVAIVWGGNLTAVLPIVNVLFEDQSLHATVDKSIAGYTQEIEAIKTQLGEIASKIHHAETTNTGNRTAHVDLLERRASYEGKLSDVSWRLFAMSWVQQRVMPWVPENAFQVFTWILVMLLIMTAIKGLFIFIQDVLVGSVVELVVMSIRKQCFRKVLMLDYQSLSADGTADLMSRFTNDFQTMSLGLSLLGGRLVREPLKAVVCIIGALVVNWRLTLLSLVFIPILGYAFYHYGRMLKRASRRMLESMSRIYKVLEETFIGLKIVIAFGGAPRHRQRFHKEHKVYYAKAMKVVQVDALTKPTIELLGMLAVIVAMLPGAYLVLRQKTEIWEIRLTNSPMDMGQLTLLYAMLLGILDPCRKMSSVYSKLKTSTAALDRIFELMDRKPTICDPPSPVRLPRLGQSIEFENVSFQYPVRGLAPARRAALDNVNLTIAAGEVVALVGENGCGKSTLVNLLPRFFDPQRGEVRIDGVPIKQAALRDLRSQIGLVTQETILFDDSIAENIRYGKPAATAIEIEEAARRAHVDSFVAELPHGFSTSVGERGGELSGGQRQRVSLARAILRDPALLILDEATSAIDAQSESLIHSTLKEFSQGRTVLLVTHMLSSSLLSFITRIVVMEEGRIAATGTHEKLLATCPQYQRLYEARSHKQAA